MNRRRQDHRKKISGIFIVAVILGVAIAGVGGIAYVHFRNNQIQTAREIDRIERRIEQHQLAIRTIEMRKDQVLNLFAMKKTLGDIGTNLELIPADATEIVQPKDPSTLASADPAL